MLPSFEIYLSILSDAWMPWLADNRKPDKFEAIMRMAGSSFHGSHPLFFAAVIQSFKKLKFGMSEKLTTEMELLSTTVESPFGKKLGQAFVTLPFLNLREHFYNTLTGQSLGAYYDMIEHFFSQNKGIETKTFYAEKMLSDLNALMCLQLPFKIENQEDQRIVLKVKLALALQFQLLLKKHGTNDTGALNYFDSRGWLEETLQQMQMDLHSAQLLLWFDSFTGKEQAVIQDKMQSKTIIEHDFREDDKGFNSEGSLSVLLMELQQDFNEIKQGIVSVVQKDQRGKTEEQTEQWMTSKDVREMMQISKSTLIRYRKSGKIKCLRIGKNYRYKKNDILQTIKENENTISKQ